MMYFVTLRNNNAKEVHLVDLDSKNSIVNSMLKQDTFVFSSFNPKDLMDIKDCYRKYGSVTGIDIREADEEAVQH